MLPFAIALIARCHQTVLCSFPGGADPLSYVYHALFICCSTNCPGDTKMCCAASLEALALSACLPSLEEQLVGDMSASMSDAPCATSAMSALVSRLHATVAFQQRLIRLIPANASIAEFPGMPRCKALCPDVQAVCMQAVLAFNRRVKRPKLKDHRRRVKWQRSWYADAEHSSHQGCASWIWSSVDRRAADRYPRNLWPGDQLVQGLLCLCRSAQGCSGCV